MKTLGLTPSAALLMSSAPALAQTAPLPAPQKRGAMIVDISNVSSELQQVISDNNLNVEVSGSTVEIAVGIAALVCNVKARDLAQQLRNGRTGCTATSETATRAELLLLARVLNRD
jgi:hypothetical protein